MSDENISVSVDVNTSEGESDSSLREDVDRHERQLEQVGENLETALSSIKSLLEGEVDELEEVNDTLCEEKDKIEEFREQSDTPESEGPSEETNLRGFY